MAHYTPEQFEALAPFAEDFRRAVERNYVHHPGRATLDAIADAFAAATGSRKINRNWGCTACVVNLMKDAGRLWLEDNDERKAAAIAEANDKAAAKATAQDAAQAKDGEATEKKAEISTPKPTTKKTPAKTAKAKTAAPQEAKTKE